MVATTVAAAVGIRVAPAVTTGFSCVVDTGVFGNAVLAGRDVGVTADSVRVGVMTAGSSDLSDCETLRAAAMTVSRSLDACEYNGG